MKIRICNTSDKAFSKQSRSLAFFLFAFWLSPLIAPARALEEGPQYIYILRAKGNPYWNSVRLGIEEAAKQRMEPVVVYMLQSETSTEEQLNTCITAIEQKPKFLGLSAANSSVGIECLKRARASGVLVGDVDCSIPAEDAKAAGVDILFSVGSDNLKIGEEAAKFAAMTLGQNPTQILVLEGAVGSIAGTLRVKGFREALPRMGENAKVVASLSADWDRMKAMSATNDILQRFPKLSLIYAANDMMALGAVEALKIHGKLAQVKVIGVDGTEDARRAVASGELTATVAQLPFLIGKRALELAMDGVAGIEVPRLVSTDTPVITKQTPTKMDKQSLEYLR